MRKIFRKIFNLLDGAIGLVTFAKWYFSQRSFGLWPKSIMALWQKSLPMTISILCHDDNGESMWCGYFAPALLPSTAVCSFRT